VVPDIVNNATRLYEFYTLADPCCASRVSVPVLWDKVERTIVSNEASDIVRMFNAAFDALGHCRATTIRSRRGKKSVQPTRVYESLNSGVYHTGFAARRDAYETAVTEVFDTLDWLEARLRDREYRVGDALKEADIHLFTTLVRFDAVYFALLW
jgi:putative glutathione S-transferase